MIVLNGAGTIADVVALADRSDQVSISPEVHEVISRAYEQAADLSTRFPTYGRTTGVGANRSTPVPPDDKDFGMRLLRSHAADAGDPLDSRTVRAMLAVRLVQIEWLFGDVTGTYDAATVEAVRGFQAKREIPVTGDVDRRTLDRLHAMTTEPTQAELTNQQGGNVPGALDQRCTTGRVLCVDKTSRTLRWVVDGTVRKTVDVRFGSEYTPTREGAFEVFSKSRDHVSSLYDTAMPFAMFFSGGQAVHYSPDFAAVGYAGASHGCVNVRDYDGIAWIYDQVQVGDTVIVYRS